MLGQVPNRDHIKESQMPREQSTDVVLIGYGAIGKEIERRLKDKPNIRILGALVLPQESDQPASFPLVTDVKDLIALKPSLVVECASHGAVQAFAGPVLMAGLDLMIISIGALADQELFEAVQSSARESQAQVSLPAGALAGIDGLSAAARAGLDWVRITSRKPPMSWSGAPGVQGIDLASIETEREIFSGSARDAARLFPKNANVAATVALAGVGFEQTQVRLLADPQATRNTHVLEFEGRPGLYTIETAGLPSEDNPKTSMLTAYNILRSIEMRGAAIVV